MPDVVIRFVACADGSPHPDIGKYLVEFDPAFAGGRGLATFSTDPKRAMTFPDALDAMRFWKTETAYGRPLTAFTIEILPRSEAR